jgi:L-threonylcarbamoyladenylate synthase
LDTVGIRMPDHPIAVALIRAAGLPIAAPSANLFTALSPTTAEHVRRGLGPHLAMVLDGGATRVGIESTVLSLSGSEPMLLRPGMISQADLEQVIGPVRVYSGEAAEAHPSPGMHRKHYTPRTPLVLIDREGLPEGRGAYLWITRTRPSARSIRMPDDAAAYAALLYDTLHELDSLGLDWIAVERPPSGIMWAGILDRLQRASANELK